MGIRQGKDVRGGLGGYQLLRMYPGTNSMRDITHILGYVSVKGLDWEIRLRVIFLEIGLGYSKHENHVTTQN